MALQEKHSLMTRYYPFIGNRTQLVKKVIIFLYFMVSNAACLPDVLAQSAQVQSWTTEDLEDVEDGQFSCPETLHTHAEKVREMERFVAWTQNRYPNWTIEQILTFRMAVLEHNACTRTLDNIREAD